MITTPSANSSALAGFALWAVGWATLFKLDKIPYLGRWFRKERVLMWMNDNKVLTLICTEIINFGVHGVTNALSVTFALGGTLFNLMMIFLGLPYLTRAQRAARQDRILKGRAA